MIKAIIFDWDGTLANSMKAIVYSFQKVLKKVDCKVNNEFIERRIGIGTKKTIIEALEECNITLDPELIEELSKEKILIQTKKTDQVNLFKGAIELLKDLEGKLKIGLATMSGRKVIDSMISSKKIEKYFDSIISADDITNPKPNPEIFLKCSNYLRVFPKDCLVIEDSIFGIRAAKAAKMKCIAVTTGQYSKKELEKEHPNLIISSLLEKNIILNFI